MALMELEKFVEIIVEKFRQEIMNLDIQLTPRKPEYQENPKTNNRYKIIIKQQTLFNRTKCK